MGLTLDFLGFTPTLFYGRWISLGFPDQHYCNSGCSLVYCSHSRDFVGFAPDYYCCAWVDFLGFDFGFPWVHPTLHSHTLYDVFVLKSRVWPDPRRALQFIGLPRSSFFKWRLGAFTVRVQNLTRDFLGFTTDIMLFGFSFGFPGVSPYTSHIHNIRD